MRRMRLSELQYELPEELIAQEPAQRRDRSRLLVLDRASGHCTHESFERLPTLLPAGSLLVLNDTRVLPARLPMRRASGGRVEGLFLREPRPGQWELMLTGSARLKVNEQLHIVGSDRQLKLLERLDAGVWLAEPVPPGDTQEILDAHGLAPLPPYIKRPVRRPTRSAGKGIPARSASKGPPARSASEGQLFVEDEGEKEGSADHSYIDDRNRYQTVYARHPGAIAAPTAGLHFTPELLQTLADAGMETTFVTLHVGVGTFAPIRRDNLAEHPMHAEWYECSEKTATAINRAREQGRPVVAIGTTSVRVLESSAEKNGRVRPGQGETRIFIYPPYRFRVVDKLITNFHLPESTLLALVFAFAGRERILAAYTEAIRQHYRFFSYGDAMLIL